VILSFLRSWSKHKDQTPYGQVLSQPLLADIQHLLRETVRVTVIRKSDEGLELALERLEESERLLNTTIELF
jgi:hypothetical protein